MMNSARHLLNQGDYPEAIAGYEQAIATDPTGRPSYWELGLAWLLQGDESQAQAVWLSLLATASLEEVTDWMAELLQVLRSEAIRQIEWGDFWAVESIARQILELDADQAEAYYWLGEAISQQGDLDQAIAYWQQAVDLNPDWVEASQQQGMVLQKLAQFNDAIACYRRVLERQPQRAETHYRLGLCLLQIGQLDQAIAHLTLATELHPHDSQAHADRGYALLQQGNLTAAIAGFQAALQFQPDFVQSYDRWRVDLVRQNQASSLVQINADFLRSFQVETAVTYLQLGTALLRSRQVQQAIACFQYAITLDSTTAEIANKLLDRLAQPAQINPLNLPDLAPEDSTPPPTKFYLSTQDWAASSTEGDRLIVLDPPPVVALNPPRTLDSTVHFSFRFGRAIALPGTFVATISQGRYWLSADQTSSAVIAPDNKFLGDLSPEFPVLSPGHPDQHPSRHSILSLSHLPPVQMVDGKVAVLSGLLNDFYFHWMLDVLPRWQLLEQSGWDIKAIDYFLVSDRLPFQQETLEILGIPAAKILSSDRYPHLQATQLIVPSFPGAIAWMPQWTCDFLKARFLDGELAQTMSLGDRLYISRQQTKNRRVINEAALLEELAPFGFKVVTLEALSVREQAALLSQAEVVIAPHGGGLTNLAFCQPGTKVIELFSPNYVYPCYWLVSNLAHLEYYYLLGETPLGCHLHQLLYPDPRTEDIYINPNQLTAILDFAAIPQIPENFT